MKIDQSILKAVAQSINQSADPDDKFIEDAKTLDFNNVETIKKFIYDNIILEGSFKDYFQDSASDIYAYYNFYAFDDSDYSYDGYGPSIEIKYDDSDEPDEVAIADLANQLFDDVILDEILQDEEEYGDLRKKFIDNKKKFMDILKKELFDYYKDTYIDGYLEDMEIDGLEVVYSSTRRGRSRSGW